MIDEKDESVAESGPGASAAAGEDTPAGVNAGAGDTAKSLFEDIAANASEGIRLGKEDAEHAARQAIPVIKSGLDKTAYSSSYAIAFGVVYAGRLLMEMLPEEGAIRRGAADGARAAREVHEQRKAAAAQEPIPAEAAAQTVVA